MPTLRYGSEQFNDGASADGSRIERALGELRNVLNHLRPVHLRRRHLPVTVCGGYRPQGPLAAVPADSFPFVGSINTAARVVGGNAVSNMSRSKGISQAGINAELGEGMLYGWEIPLAFPDGGIFDGVSFHAGLMVWPGAPLPPGKSVGASVDDISIEVQVDSPSLPTKRSLSAQELLKRDFKLESFNINRNAPGYAATDFYPSGGAGTRTTYGAMVMARGLNIPIPIGGMARLVFTMPSYAGTAYNSAWNNRPWWAQYSWTASLLKPLRR